METEVLSVRRYKAGYEVRKELVENPGFHAEVISEGDDPQAAQELADTINQPQPETLEIKSAYTLAGDYIGNPKAAYRLCTKRGIKPEKVDSSHNTCSIGFCEAEQKWFGWSHRAIYGFGVGEEVKEGDCCASSGWTEEYLKEHPEEDLRLPVGFKAESLDDAKRMAIAFAESVG